VEQIDYEACSTCQPAKQLIMLTVIMPVWNGARYLREAIESILNQSVADFEFLILDDGSTDQTPDILREFGKWDPRIRVINLAHEGIVKALNCGVAEARGDDLHCTAPARRSNFG